MLRNQLVELAQQRIVSMARVAFQLLENMRQLEEE